MAVQNLKSVAIVAPHFVPSNLASVHRSRLWSLHLREFGWEPIIVTTHWDYYEEKIEPGLLELIPPDLKVIRSKVFGTKPIRVVGDVGLRAFRQHYRALCELAGSKSVDFVHITISSNYSALPMPMEWDEPFGIVMVEAIDYGTPVIAFRRSSVPAVVRDGVSGLLDRDAAGAVFWAQSLSQLNRQHVRDDCEKRFDHGGGGARGFRE